MHQIEFDKQQYEAPAEWNQLAPEQLISYAALLLRKESKKNMVKLLLCIAFRIPYEEFQKLQEFQVTQLSPLVEFLHNGQNKLNKWLISEISYHEDYSKVKLYGPANRLSNITIREFRYLEMYYNAYLLTKQESYLNQLIACLYRPMAESGADTDIRQPLSEIQINQRAKTISRQVNKRTKHAILINYEGCRNFIFEKYSQWVFKKSLPNENSQPAKPQLYDYDNMIQAVAGAKFGTYKETGETPIFPFFEHLSQQIEQAEKSKKK